MNKQTTLVDTLIFDLLHTETASAIFGTVWYNTPTDVREELVREWKARIITVVAYDKKHQ